MLADVLSQGAVQAAGVYIAAFLAGAWVVLRRRDL